MPTSYILSRRGLAALRQQLDRLTEDLNESTAAMGRSAAIDNDLRENPEFMQLRTKVTYELPSKINELRRVLSAYTIIENTPEVQTGIFEDVQPGAEVTIESADGHVRVFSILGFGDGDPARGIISYLSPVGVALLNQPIGQEINLSFGGKTKQYIITSIRKTDHVR
jgi:transcription elongation GreA/GreB family factor